MDQINSVIVKINMDATGNEPRFVVEEVIAQPGSCFEGAENLLRARFECLCCKTGYVVLPLITPTVKMEVSITEDDPTSIQPVVEHVSEGVTGSTLDEAVDSDEGQKQDDEFDDFKIEAELFLREDSDEMAPLVWPLEHPPFADQITDSKEGDFERNPSEGSSNKVVNSNEGDGYKDSEMVDDMEVNPNSVETPPVKQQVRFDQSSDSKECEVITPSEERSLKMQCLRSMVVIRLFRVDEEAREKDVPIAPIEPQERNVEGGFYQCDICKAFIKHRKHLTRHMNSHLGIRYSCSDCQESFSDKSHLSTHKKCFHQSEFRICEVCKRSKTCTKAEYHSHLRRRHPEFHIEGRQSKVQNFNGDDFPCIYCEPQATFTNFEELEDHLSLTHDRSFACARCPKAWTVQLNLKHHIESVHEKKTFKCPKCDKVFQWKRSLNRHLHSHK